MQAKQEAKEDEYEDEFEGEPGLHDSFVSQTQNATKIQLPKSVEKTEVRSQSQDMRQSDEYEDDEEFEDESQDGPQASAYSQAEESSGTGPYIKRQGGL